MSEGRIILLTLAVLFTSVNVTGTWKRVDSGTFAWLRAVYFQDDDHGWVGGSNGTLLSTSNGGSRWVKHTAAGKATVRDILFLDRQNGWVLCDRGRSVSDVSVNPSYLLRTKDGGASWSTVELARSGERFVRLFASPGSRLFLLGEGGVMASLNESDPVERRSVLPTRFLMLGGTMLDRDRLVLVGGGGEILLTNENGGEWASAEVAGAQPRARLNAVHFIDSEHGWAAGNEGRVLESRNGGKLWRTRDPKTSADLLDVRFLNAGVGFVIGDGGHIFSTGNGGESWTRETSGTKHRLERIALSNTKAYVVGFGGSVLVRSLQATEAVSGNMKCHSSTGKGGVRCAGS